MLSLALSLAVSISVLKAVQHCWRPTKLSGAKMEMRNVNKGKQSAVTAAAAG